MGGEVDRPAQQLRTIMPDIPQAAIAAAADAVERELMSGTSYSTFAESDDVLARVALEAAAPILVAQEIARCNRERDAILRDLGQLLEVLGLGDYARPESPHEVMLQCIAEVKRLRQSVVRLRRVDESDNDW